MTSVFATRPVPSAPRPYRFPAFERHELTNGLRLLVAPMHKLPLVTVTLVVDAGAMTEPAGGDGVASLTARALLEGTARLSAAELTGRLERIGASVSSDGDWDTAGAGVTVLRAHLEEAVGAARGDHARAGVPISRSRAAQVRTIGGHHAIASGARRAGR